MKLKFKPTKRQLAVGGVIVVAAFGLLANRSADQPAQQTAGGPLDAAARQACDDFDAGYRDAERKPERLALADKVMTSTRRSENKAIAERADEAGQNAADGGTAWRRSADAFTSACTDAGWRAP